MSDELTDLKPVLTDPPVSHIDDLGGEVSKPLKYQTDASKASGFVGYNTGIGDSKYDKGFLPNHLSDLGSVDDALQRHRAGAQGGWDEFGNGVGRLTNIIPEAIGSVASALDFEDYFNSDNEVGNWLTDIMEDWKESTNESLPIYRENPGKPLDFGDTAWWFENGSSLVQSIGGFAIGGGVITKGLVGLSKLVKAQKIATAVMGVNAAERTGKGLHAGLTAAGLNQAEAILEAGEVYDVTFELMMAKPGVSIDEAKQKAADAAAVTIKTNRINILLNLSSAGMFMRAPKRTRHLLKKETIGKNLGIGTIEGVQESAEEIINLIAGNKGKAFGRDEEYGYDQIMEDIKSPEAIEAGLLGFMGGLGQTAVTKEGVNRVMKVKDPLTGEKISVREYNKQAYNKQKAILEEYKGYANAANVKDFSSVYNTTIENLTMIQAFKKAVKEGDMVEAERIQNLTLDNQAYNAFTNGTTEGLVQFYQDLVNGEQKEGMPDNYKEVGKKAIKKVRTLEKIYNETSKHINAKEVYLNLARIETVSDIADDLKAVHDERKGDVQKVVDIFSNMKKYNPSSNIELRIQDLETQLNVSDLDGKEYDDHKKFIDKVMSSPEYKRYESAYQRWDQADLERDALYDEYNKITSKEYQTDYKKRLINAEETLAKRLDETSDNIEEEVNIEEEAEAKAIKVEEALAAFKKNQQEKAEKLKKKEGHLNWIKDNIAEGEELVLPEGFKNAGDEVTLIRIEEDAGDGKFKLIFVLPDGTQVSARSKPGDSIEFDSNVSQLSSTEGSDIEDDIDHNETSTEGRTQPGKEGRAHTRLMSTTDAGEPLVGIPQAYLNWEKEPVDKLGTQVTFEINTDALPVDKNTERFQKALDLVEASKTRSLIQEEVDHIIAFLPVKVKVSDDVYSFIPSLPLQGGETAGQAWRNTELVIRTQLVKQLLDKGNLDGLSSKVMFQYGGTIQLEDKVVENNIMDLDQITNMGELEFMIVNSTGRLVSTNGKATDITVNPRWKGSLFVWVKKANGERFPMKLNIQKFNSADKASVIFDMYQQIMENDNIHLKSTLSELSEDMGNAITETMSDELALFKKPFRDITINELVDLMVWQDAESYSFKNRLNVYNGTIKFGTEEITPGTVTPERKQEFIDWLVSNKRRHIKFRPKKDDVNNFNMTNPTYVKYLVNNKIINTNAKTEGPLFDGFAYVYISSVLNNDSIVPPAPTAPSAPDNAPDKRPEPEPAVEAKTWEAVAYAQSLSSISYQEMFNGYLAFKFDKNGNKVDGEDFFALTKEQLISNMKEGYQYFPKDIQDNQFTPKAEIVEEIMIKDKPERPAPQQPQASEVEISALNLIDILNLKKPTTPGINKILGLSLTDSSAIDLLESKGILSKHEGAKGKRFLMSKDEALAVLNTTQQTSEVEATIKEVEKNKEFIVLSKDQKNYINTKTGKVYERVTKFISETGKDLKETPLLLSSQTIGTKVDELVRDFFAGELKPLTNYDVSSQKELKSFIEGLAVIKKSFDERGETVMANDIVLYNDELGVAGTVDLLTYDKKGEIRIYDMKTMRGNNFLNKYTGDEKTKYDSTRYGKTKRQKHEDQLNLYRILLNNTHGLKAKTLGVMPIEIKYNEGDTTTSVLKLLKGVQLKTKNKVSTASIQDYSSSEPTKLSKKDIALAARKAAQAKYKPKKDCP